MSEDEQHHRFTEQLKARLDRTEAALDPATVAALRTARQEALTTPRRLGWKMPSAAFASLIFGAVLINSLMMPSEPPVPMALFEDIALLSAEEELEMYEDIDLILWLLEEEANSDLG